MKGSMSVIVALLLSGITASAGWFDNGAEKKLEEAQRQLVQAQQKSGDWQLIAAGLAVACIGLLVAGTMIGSRVRHSSNPLPPPSNAQPSREQ